MRVGFVGVGAMGSAMAGHVVRAGYEVVVFDTDEDALGAAAVDGIKAAPSLADMAAETDVVIVMVASDDQSRAVVTALLEGDGGAPGTIVIAATNHPATMIELGSLCANHAVGFVDAPVCYGLQGAIAGELASLCGGSEADVARVRPVLESYSRSVDHLGPQGCGQLGKTCNNMMHWAACVANYEVLSLARACGIDAQFMRETLLKCPARNTTLERWDTSRFTWQEKDMDVALELSQQAGLSLPLFGLVDQLVKRLGPDQVRALLYEDAAQYLGLPIPENSLAAIADRA